MTKMPLKHLAIIMDGNGRWAKERGLPRVKGHEAGVEIIRDVSIYCANDSEIETVTFYAFSTENWNRPKLEVEFLMKLLKKYLEQELPEYQKNGICFKMIGDITGFSKPLQKCIRNTEEATKDNTRLTQILALNYGGRQEITLAVNTLIKRGKTSLSETDISDALQTPYSDIDLLVRTSGEERISNFLLWQLSYAEISFTDTLWPDFSTSHLKKLIDNYQNRHRRFGSIS